MHCKVGAEEVMREEEMKREGGKRKRRRAVVEFEERIEVGEKMKRRQWSIAVKKQQQQQNMFNILLLPPSEATSGSSVTDDPRLTNPTTGGTLCSESVWFVLPPASCSFLHILSKYFNLVDNLVPTDRKKHTHNLTNVPQLSIKAGRVPSNK